MSALPKPMPIDEVVAEHHSSRPVVLATDPAPTVPPTLTFSETIQALRDAQRCPDCGKTRAVLNIGGYRRQFRPERVTPHTHCACVDGPAYGMTAAFNSPAPIVLADFVVKVFDGALGDHALPFSSVDAACDVVAQLLAERAGRALLRSEEIKIGIVVSLEFQKRRAAAAPGGAS